MKQVKNIENNTKLPIKQGTIIGGPQIRLLYKKIYLLHIDKFFPMFFSILINTNIFI